MTYPLKFDNKEIVSARLPSPTGDIFPVTMEGWYWNALDWICYKTHQKEHDFVGWAIDNMDTWQLSFDDAMKYVIHRYYKRFTGRLREWRDQKLAELGTRRIGAS